MFMSLRCRWNWIMRAFTAIWRPRAQHSGVKRILTMLAEEEVKHYNIVKAMATQCKPRYDPDHDP